MSLAAFQFTPGVEPPYNGWGTQPLPGNNPDGGAALARDGRIEQSTTTGFGEWLEYQRINHEASEMRQFGRDFYDRIHISTIQFDLGNVIGNQEREFSIWNAYRRVQPMAAITESGTEGLSIEGQTLPPIEWGPLQERAYTLNISTSGPPTINASYTWDFLPYDVTLTIVGSRVTAWLLQPDWTRPILERLEWSTDVIIHFDGSEQRRSTRLAPRKRYEFDAFIDGKARRYAENVIFGWGARNWALPIWPDGQSIEADLPVESDVIPIDTETRDYVVGGFAILLADAFNFEIVEIAAVDSSQVTLARPTTQVWPVGTVIYPARLARLNADNRLPRWDGQASSMRASFEVQSTVDYTADAGTTVHRGYPILTTKPEWSGGFDLEMERKLDQIDSITGLREYDDESGIPFTRQRMRWTWVDRQEQDTYRKLIYALRGRQGAIWVPTWEDDLVVNAVIGSTAEIIEVDWCGYTLQINLAPSRRDIRVELFDGTIYYRRIVSTLEVDATTERLGIDAAFGRTIEPEEIAKISFMALCRLDADAVELAHWTGEVADSATTFRSFRDDV